MYFFTGLFYDTISNDIGAEMAYLEANKLNVAYAASIARAAREEEQEKERKEKEKADKEKEKDGEVTETPRVEGESTLSLIPCIFKDISNFLYLMCFTHKLCGNRISQTARFCYYIISCWSVFTVILTFSLSLSPPLSLGLSLSLSVFLFSLTFSLSFSLSVCLCLFLFLSFSVSLSLSLPLSLSYGFYMY